MTRPADPFVIRPNPRLLRRCLLVYLSFIIYASLIPFIFNLDPNFAQWRFDIFISKSLYRGMTHWSWSDVVSNVLLYFPFGVFCVGSLRDRQWLARSTITPLIVTIFGLFLAFEMELGQTLAPYRSPSMLDVFSNGFGALLGAVAGQLFFNQLSGSLGSKIIRLVRDRPSDIVFAMLLLGLAVDNYYPFHFVFDHIRVRWSRLPWFFSSYLWPAFPSTWIGLFIDKGMIFIALAYIIFCQQQKGKYKASALKAWFRASVIGVMIESGKIFFLGPTFRLANILIYSAGALCGVTIIPFAAKWAIIRRRSPVVLLAVVLALLCYFELWPFDWIDRFELPAKIAQIEWLPLLSYFLSPPQAAFFDLSKKLFLTLPVGFLIAASFLTRDSHYRVRYAMAIGAIVGILLEGAQLAVRSRVASVTDILTISFGSWLGAVAFEWFSRMRITADHLEQNPDKRAEVSRFVGH